MTTVIEAPQDKKVVKIGDYQLTGKIGQGGVAEVYRARQESLNRDVAIKVLSIKLSNDPDIVRRFERESMVIAKLNHPNIVHVIDKGKAGGRYYFVMEYVDGTSLRQVIDTPSIPLETKLDMVIQVLKSLDYAHKNGVIHRDIKPSNILVDRQGNVQVADFGIAQILGAPDTEMTATDVVLGTISYMSPEQKVSSTNVDQTTDLYAIGVMLYEIFTSKKPLGHFKTPSEMNPTINPAFDAIVMKCLAQEPKDRYQAAVELKDAILEVIGSLDRIAANRDEFAVTGTDSFLGRCRYLDTIRETQHGSTILVENKVNKKLYVLKKHAKGEAGRKEAKLLSSLKHPNINAIYGAGGDPRTTVIISNYCQGGSLADRMVRRYEWEKGLAICMQIAAGLDFAHKNNIVHGNLRPSNVLFDADETVKLADFGLPTHYDAMGKKNWYSAPERKISKSGDLYALGVIMHQLLLGRNPGYDSGNNIILDKSLVLPEGIKRILAKLLSIRTSARYQSCQELLLDWEEFQGQRSYNASEPESVVESFENKRFSIAPWVWVLTGGLAVAGVLTLLRLIGLF